MHPPVPPDLYNRLRYKKQLFRSSTHTQCGWKPDDQENYFDKAPFLLRFDAFTDFINYESTSIKKNHMPGKINAIQDLGRRGYIREHRAFINACDSSRYELPYVTPLLTRALTKRQSNVLCVIHLDVCFLCLIRQQIPYLLA